MLGLFLKNRIFCNVWGSLIITIKIHQLARNTPREARKDLIQINSLATLAMAPYSASAEDLGTVLCFFVFQETGDPPSVTTYPVRDCLVRGHAP